MTESEARAKIDELVAARLDVFRFQQALTGINQCPEVQSSAAQKLSHLAQQALKRFDGLRIELVRALAGSQTQIGWSLPDADDPTAGSGVDLGATRVRVPRDE